MTGELQPFYELGAAGTAEMRSISVVGRWLDQSTKVSTVVCAIGQPLRGAHKRRHRCGRMHGWLASAAAAGEGSERVYAARPAPRSGRPMASCEEERSRDVDLEEIWRVEEEWGDR